MTGPHGAVAGKTSEERWAWAIFCLLLGFHFWGATVGWRSRNLPGCEFRQTQTAISALFIQHEQNFSLAYPTPVLGKPWAIPMEFPLYQWTVVGVSDFFHQPLTQAARAVSLACFYLALPALFLLLLRTGLARARCWLVLGFVVTCPLYIFYARSFLIETMALMFGAWFLVGYVRAAERRSLGWLGVAAVAGAGCGLVKVTTFFFFLMPAFLETLGWFWTDWSGGPARRARLLLTRVGWCAAAVVVPFATSIWWVRYSDAIKAASVAGKFLVSSNLTSYNFGIGVRFSPGIWAQHWNVLVHDLTSVPVLVLGTLLAVIFARRRAGLLAALLGLFLVVQAVFPILYAWHEYYYVANAFLLMFALGFAACGVFDSRLPRWAGWAAVLLLYGLQIGGYFTYYYPSQQAFSNGGSNLTVALKRVLAPDEVMIIAGDDWSSMTPYYAERRAYMIRRNLETTWQEIEPAFEQLGGEDVTALLLHGEQAKNAALIAAAAKRFHLDPRPAFRWRDATVYVHEQLRPRVKELLAGAAEIELVEPVPGDSDPLLGRELRASDLLRRFTANFATFAPAPVKFYSTFGITQFDYHDQRVLNAHPDSRFWFQLPAGAHTFSGEIGVADGAYEASLPRPQSSDGIEVKLEVELPDGTRRLLGSRGLDPREVPADRGLVRVELAFTLDQPAVVVLSIGPGPARNYSRDWAMIGRVEIK